MNNPTWEVYLQVDGPVTIPRRLTMTQQKGFRIEDPFYSDIELTSNPLSGFRAKVTARAPSQELAYEAAVFFFGRMLDALSLVVDLPMHLSLTERQAAQNGRSREQTRRIIDLREIESAFSEAHHLAINSPSFLRGLGWYRKGNYTEDPLDKFLAFWNAIEIVASKYYRYIPEVDLNRAKGSKGQIWECLKALWGTCENWPIITGDIQWIDDSYETRKGIAHGLTSVDIAKVSEIFNRIGKMRQVAHRFLRDARGQLLTFERNPPSEIVLVADGET